MNHLTKSICRILLLLFFAGYFTVTVVSCGRGGSEASTASDAGSVGFAYHVSTAGTPSDNICADYRIDYINLTIFRDNIEVSSAQWPCDQHGGSMDGLPVGGGYSLTLEGIVGGDIHWRGEALDFVIIAGEFVDLGRIELVYVGDDTEAPLVISTTPSADQTQVAVASSIIVTFSESVVEASWASNAPVTVAPSGGATVTGGIVYDDDARTLTFTPSADLNHNTEYQVLVGPDIQDRAGLAMDQVHTFTFTTIHQAPPSGLTVTLSPRNGASDVPTDTPVTADFNRPMDAGSLVDEVRSWTWITYLSQMVPVSHSNLYGGAPSFDTDVFGDPIIINENPYKYGVGTHAPHSGIGRVDFAIGGASRFKAVLGIATANSSAEGDVVFTLYVDDVQRYNSELVKWGDPEKNIDIDVSGGEILTLEISKFDADAYSDHGIWAMARLEGQAGATGSIYVETEGRPVEGVTTYDEINHQAVFTPTRRWEHNQTYHVTLSGEVRAADGTVLGAPERSVFTAAEATRIPIYGAMVNFSSVQGVHAADAHDHCFAPHGREAFGEDSGDSRFSGGGDADPEAGTYRIWHVDSGRGDDDGDGSEASPLRTFARALDLAEKGDRVCVAPGNYPVETIQSVYASSRVEYSGFDVTTDAGNLSEEVDQ